MKFNLYLEQIFGSDSLFKHLFSDLKEEDEEPEEELDVLYVPLSQKILGSLIKQNKRNVFFHICSEKDALKIIKMQGLKTKPISCFIKTNVKFIESGGVFEESNYIIKLKGISLSDFSEDIYSVTDKIGSYRMVELTRFNITAKEEYDIIEKYNNFRDSFIKRNSSRIKELTNVSDIKNIFRIKKTLIKNKTKESGILKRDFISECIDFWTKIIKKYNIYNTVKFNKKEHESHYSESLVVNYKIIEILSSKEKTFINKDYEFKYFKNSKELTDYINKHKEKI